MPEARTAADPRELVGANLDRYAAAAAGRSERVVDLHIAHRPVRLRVVGDELAALLVGALGHLVAPVAEPELTLCAWDGTPSGLAADALGPDPNPLARTMVRGDGALVVIYADGSTMLQGYDPGRRSAFLWARDVDALSRTGDRTKPALESLHAWLVGTAWQPVHAGAVGTEHGGVLLAGPAGSGKSTTALACLRAGWRYAGDDYVAVTDSPGPAVAPLYRTARLEVAMAERFPELMSSRVGTVALPDRAKFDLHLGEGVAPAIGGFPLRALLLPRVTGGETTLVPAPHAAAMIGLATTTLFQLRSDSALAFEKIANFVTTLPAYHLKLGYDIDAIPAAITAATGVGPA